MASSFHFKNSNPCKISLINLCVASTMVILSVFLIVFLLTDEGKMYCTSLGRKTALYMTHGLLKKKKNTKLYHWSVNLCLGTKSNPSLVLRMCQKI